MCAKFDILVYEKGIVRPPVDEFYEASKGVDVRCIRGCLYCRQIFWADRVDKVCCSNECVKAENIALYSTFKEFLFKVSKYPIKSGVEKIFLTVFSSDNSRNSNRT